jgi:hypothetical protein
MSMIEALIKPLCKATDWIEALLLGLLTGGHQTALAATPTDQGGLACAFWTSV